MKRPLNMTYLRRLRRAKQLQFIDVDNAWGSQCWDLIKDYCIECFDRNPPQVGVARNATARHFPAPKFKELKVGVDDFEQGDIVIVDLIPKNKFGHIFIVHRQFKSGLRYVDQNGIGGAWSNGKAVNRPGNGVELRNMRRGQFTILKAFRPVR